MSEILYMILAFIAGIAFGVFFFAGLWFTIKKAVLAKTPAVWFFGSFFLRIAVVMIGFYYIIQGGWQRLVICVIGFMIARVLVTQYTKSIDKKQNREELYHEA